MSTKQFEGRKLLVLGGTSGMGLQTAKRVAEEGGAVVVVGQLFGSSVDIKNANYNNRISSVLVVVVVSVVLNDAVVVVVVVVVNVVAKYLLSPPTTFYLFQNIFFLA